MDERYGIAVFRSRSQVLALEAAARRSGIPGRVVSSPRSVSAGCGLSFMVDKKDMPAISELVRKGGYGTLIGLYWIDPTPGRPRLRLYAREN